MRTWIKTLAIFVSGVVIAAAAWAQEPGSPAAAAAAAGQVHRDATALSADSGAEVSSEAPASVREAAEKKDIPHPVGARDTTWAGAMVIVILGLFVAAAAVGVVVRANTPDEVHDAHNPHAEDEAHGDAHSGSHGHH